MASSYKSQEQSLTCWWRYLNKKARWSAKRGCHNMSYSVNCSRLIAALMCMCRACVKNCNLFMTSLSRRFVVKVISWCCNDGRIDAYLDIQAKNHTILAAISQSIIDGTHHLYHLCHGRTLAQWQRVKRSDGCTN